MNTTGAVNATTQCVVFETHDMLFHVVDTVRGAPNDTVHSLAPYGVVAASLILCFFGYYALRTVVGIAAFATGVVGTARVLDMGGTRLGEDGDRVLTMSCDVASVLVLVGGGTSALVAVFLTKMLSVVLGAAGACVVVGAVFASCGAPCNAELWGGAPRFLGMSIVPFWACMSAATVVGAVVARKRHREMLATVAALLGGVGVASSVQSLVMVHGDTRLPNWSFLLVAVVSAGRGLGAQYYWVKRQAAGKRKLIKTVACTHGSKH